MGTASMAERMAETSPRLKARVAGGFYLLSDLVGIFNVLFVVNRLLVFGNAAATATNILAQQPLFWAGFAAQLIASACYVVVTALLYGLLKPVNRSLSLLAAFFSLVGLAVGAVGSLFQLAPLVILQGGGYLSVFPVKQLQALALLNLNLATQVYNIDEVFYGFYLLLIGYLIFRSTFLPRLLGVLVALAGVGWLAFLSPPLANALSPYNLPVGALGELSLTFWLLVMGVNAKRWKEQQSRAWASLPT